VHAHHRPLVLHVRNSLIRYCFVCCPSTPLVRMPTAIVPFRSNFSAVFSISHPAPLLHHCYPQAIVRKCDGMSKCRGSDDRNSFEMPIAFSVYSLSQTDMSPKRTKPVALRNRWDRIWDQRPMTEDQWERIDKRSQVINDRWKSNESGTWPSAGAADIVPHCLPTIQSMS
jgi:hypothetical protein